MLRQGHTHSEGRKDLVMKRRRFTQDFKRSIVEQLLSETTSPAELCRRYNIAPGQLYTWKKLYAQGKLDTEPPISKREGLTDY